MDTANVSVALALFAGILSFLSPCVLPLAPAYVGYLSGTAIVDERISSPPSRWRTFIHAVGFVLGFSAVFVALGASVGLIGYTLYGYMPVLQKIGGVLLVIFGLHQMGLIRVRALYRELRWQMPARWRLGYASSVLVGVFFGAGWTPCIGVTLSSILMLAANEATVGRGALLLSVYSAGLGIPFLLMGLGLHRVSGWLQHVNRRMRIVSVVSGLFLIGMGFIVYTNAIGILNAWFFRTFGFATFL
ncbi:MAG: cytochrome c biogenesis protein CcdA [Anaerolineae bacterium]